MKRRSLLLSAMLCLSLLTAVTARAQDKGIIQGWVVNGTADGGSVGGLEVVLHAFQGTSEGEPHSTTTDAQGQFRFEGLETGTDWVYLLRVGYEDVMYSGEMLSFQGTESELPTEVRVYETTTSGEGIAVGRAHILVTASDAGLSVTELYVFANTTDRTYVGAQQVDGRRWTSKFLLPPGSHDLTLDDGSIGGRFLSDGNGFVDTEPQWPGSTQVLFTYALDCRSGTCDLARELAHPIANINVLVPDVGAAVDSEHLAFQGKMDAQEQSFLNYAASNLAAGTDLDLRIRLRGNALPQGTSSSPQSRTQALPWIILGTVLVGLVLIYPFWRRRIEAAARKGE